MHTRVTTPEQYVSGGTFTPPDHVEIIWRYNELLDCDDGIVVNNTTTRASPLPSFIEYNTGCNALNDNYNITSATGVNTYYLRSNGSVGGTNDYVTSGADITASNNPTDKTDTLNLVNPGYDNRINTASGDMYNSAHAQGNFDKRGQSYGTPDCGAYAQGK